VKVKILEVYNEDGGKMKDSYEPWKEFEAAMKNLNKLEENCL
jgi:hypothetical protein